MQNKQRENIQSRWNCCRFILKKYLNFIVMQEKRSMESNGGKNVK